MEEIRLWKLVQASNGMHSAEAIKATDQTTTEKLLEEMLTSSPGLLMDGLSIIGRQNETQGGPLDLLGVDEEGRLVVFELKRGTLTRDAVAQALGYASYLADLSDEKLNTHITSNSGRYGVAKIDDFGKWYESKYPKTLSDIGKPRIVLVGIGVDECTKRIVSFLAQSDLDISIITFHAFLEAGQTYLAKQVETRSRVGNIGGGGTKAGNRAELHATLDEMGIKTIYERFADAVRTALGPTTYQWPYTTGYTFSRPGPSSTGGKTLLAYLALYVDPNRPGEIRVNLQPRAVTAAGQSRVEEIAKKMGGDLIKSPAGYANFWIGASQNGQEALLVQLATEIVGGSQPQNDNPGEGLNLIENSA